MAWLADPRKWADEWWAGLSLGARWIWEACLTGPYRTVVPGLCKGVNLYTLHSHVVRRIRRPERRFSFDEFATDLAEVLEPDTQGKIHFYLDTNTEVARIPMAPAYNHADNPSVLASWYRHWRDVPDCELKFEHIASLRLGVNFSLVDKHGRHSMVEKWDATFGQPERAYLDGKRQLKTYADLQERRIPTQPTLPYPTGTLGAQPGHRAGHPAGHRAGHPASGSGIKDLDRDRDLDLDQTVSNTVPDTVPGLVAQPPRPLESSRKKSQPKANSNGGVDDETSRPGVGPYGTSNGEGGRASVAQGGGGGGGRSLSPVPGSLSVPRRPLPRGLE